VPVVNQFGTDGHYRVETTKVNADGSRTTSSREYQLSSDKGQTVRIDNLDYRNNKNQQTVAIEVTVTAVQLRNDKWQPLDGSTVRIEMPRFP